MDWTNYVDGAKRSSSEVYEDNYVSSWRQDEVSKLMVPVETASSEIKARIVECKESNKYNITQDLAEAFEVFCEYEYTCNQKGEFKKTYTSEIDDKVWTGRKVIFHNKGIRLDDAITIDYQKNLQNISVTSESSEIYSKLYVKPTESEHMTNGYITIADTDLNPTGEDYILNFDYMYANGAITDYQYSQVKVYEAQMYEKNQQLRALSTEVNDLTVKSNNLEADLTSIENNITSTRESLVTYQGLRAASVTNDTLEFDSSRPYTAICIPSTDGTYYSARLTAEGISIGTIKAYNNISCLGENLFDGSKLIVVANGIGTNTDNIYALVDDYGYATQINIPAQIFEGSDVYPLWNSVIASIYLTFSYSPENKYAAMCEKLQSQLDTFENKKAVAAQEYENSEQLLENKTKEYDDILKEKQELITRFERLMGPALQEGYWQPDAYEDPGETINGEIGTVAKVSRIFDEVPFEGETVPYYYASIEDVNNDNPTYYSYYIIPDYVMDGIRGKERETIIRMSAPSYTYTVTFEEGLEPAYYFIILDGKKYYTKNAVSANQNQTWTLVTGSGVPQFNGSNMSTSPKEGVEYYNCTSMFEGLSSYLSVRSIFPNAGYEYGYIKDKKTNKIFGIILFSDTSIPYELYGTYELYYADGAGADQIESLYKDISSDWSNYTFVYPRIKYDYLNLNSDSDSFKVSWAAPNVPYDETFLLTNYEDYYVLSRGISTYATLKTTNANPMAAIIGKTDKSETNYYVNFQISRANDILYLDAKQVAKDNSQPRLSYSLTVANTPDSMKKIVLGQLVFVNDFSVDVHRAPGYISGLTLALDNPKEDEITIANYKTKFEDLFSTITASSEAMKNNKRSYDIASSAFVGGQLSGTILQQALAQNTISLSFSKTSVDMTDGEGIVLTNTTPYTNGVYGQVVLRGGGIFCSSQLDDAGNRIWNSAITPRGINANYITAGQLDTNLIRIYSGNNMAFQWNSEGLFAYRQDEEGNADLSTFVKYSEHGLQFQQGTATAVSLGWNGLNISTQGGALTLTGDRGLTMYNENGNIVLHLGRSGQLGSYLYGLTLYDGTDSAIKTFYSTNDGELWLKKRLMVGEEGGYAIPEEGEEDTIYEGNCAGISGLQTTQETVDEEGNVFVEEVNDIRFWAGSVNFDEESIANAPFRVYEDGSFVAAKGEIDGAIIKENSITIGALAAGSITADKIAAGTVTSETLASNRLESLNPSPNRYIEDKKQFEYVSQYTTEGSYIDFTKNGSIHFKNFYIDDSGNTGVRGHLEAQSGFIAGHFTIGEGVNTIKFNGDNSTYAIESAHFNVTSSGEINATAGKIANWTIGENLLYADGGLVGMYAGNEDEYLYGDDSSASHIRFFAGAADSVIPNFIVTADGSLYAKKAEISGHINAESGSILNNFYIGDSNSGILLDGANKAISSIPFASGVNGWKIDKDGNAEFNNATIRGTLQSVIFEVNTVSAIGGDLYVAPTIQIPASDGTLGKLLYNSTSKKYSITVKNEVPEERHDNYIQTENGTVVYATMVQWDKAIVVMNMNIITANGTHKKYDDVRGTIDFNGNQNNFTISIDHASFKESATADNIGQLNNATIEYDLTIIKLGQSDSYKYIYLTANHQNGLATPYIDIQDYAVENESTASAFPRVRLGNLSGISVSKDIFGFNGQLDGYGLYSDRAYLTGLLALPNAGVTNQTEVGYNGGDSYTVEDLENSAIRLWAGSSMPTIDASAGDIAPFIVTQDGSLYATKGIFRGRVEAENSKFSGTIQAAGILVEQGGDGYTYEARENHFFVGYKEKPESFDDYILDMSSAGLRIWEGGFNVYSDYMSGWNDSKTIATPYAYNKASVTNTFPYISAIDKGRLAVKDLHIMSPIFKASGANTTVDKFSSIYTDSGKLCFSAAATYTSGGFEATEDNLYGHQMGSIYIDNDFGGITMASQNSAVTISLNEASSLAKVKANTLQIAKDNIAVDLLLGEATIREIKEGNTTVGFNFIV